VQLNAKPGRVGHIQRSAKVSLAWAGVLGPEFGQPLVPRHQGGTAGDPEAEHCDRAPRPMPCSAQVGRLVQAEQHSLWVLEHDHGDAVFVLFDQDAPEAEDPLVPVAAAV
jgi:hypothetical protein